MGFQYERDQKEGESNNIQNIFNLQWQANGTNLKQNWELIQQNPPDQQFWYSSDIMQTVIEIAC